MKKINLIELSSNLIRKFNTSQVDVDEGPLLLANAVQPVIDVNQCVYKPIQKEAVTPIGGNGYAMMFRVPYNQKWRVEHIFGEINSGTYLIGRIAVKRNYYQDTLSNPIPLIGPSPSTSTYSSFAKEIELLPGDEIYILVSSFTVNGNLSCGILVKIEAFNG